MIPMTTATATHPPPSGETLDCPSPELRSLTELLRQLTMASEWTFVVYVLVGGILAILVTRTVTRSIEEAATARAIGPLYR